MGYKSLLFNFSKKLSFLLQHDPDPLFNKEGYNEPTRGNINDKTDPIFCCEIDL